MNQEESTNKPPKKRVAKKEANSGMLPKMEILTIGVLFLSFLAWTIPKCSSTQQEFEKKEDKKREKIVESTPPKKEIKTAPIKAIDTTSVKKSVINRVRPEKVTVLYVVLDDLKLRKGHHLDSSIVKVLNLNEEVSFLEEVTDFKQEINLGDRMAKEPWIKVRAATGHEGWVYGAGVNYFKPKKQAPVESEVGN